jgi:hypothetical protein
VVIHYGSGGGKAMSNLRLATALLAVLCGSVSPVQALENFIPLGPGYAPEVESLPPPDTYENSVMGQTDVYESEIDRIQRERKIFENELSRFIDHDLSAEPLHTPQY